MLSRRALLALGTASVLFPTPGLGQEKREGEGGIGGTGIVGVLTDFGSLILAGSRVEFGRGTRFEDVFGPLSDERLRVGDSLTVEASGPADALVARRVRVNYPLIGTVTEASGGRLVVNGTPVRLERSGGARVGDRVAVLGVWRGNEVIASRLAAPRSDRDLVSGTATRQGLGSRIGGLDIAGRGRSSLRNGGFGEAIGRYDPASGAFVAERMITERFLSPREPLTRLAVEGYLEPAPGRPGFRVSGLGHSFARSLRLSGLSNQRILFVGDYNGLFAPTQATRLPEAFAARRALLRSLSQ
ncbi:MAG: DUF5666 domain-containing protein [Pseudomonadota bacterium]